MDAMWTGNLFFPLYYYCPLANHPRPWLAICYVLTINIYLPTLWSLSALPNLPTYQRTTSLPTDEPLPYLLIHLHT
jgi:hypothetical protein